MTSEKIDVAQQPKEKKSKKRKAEEATATASVPAADSVAAPVTDKKKKKKKDKEGATSPCSSVETVAPDEAAKAEKKKKKKKDKSSSDGAADEKVAAADESQAPEAEDAEAASSTKKRKKSKSTSSEEALSKSASSQQDTGRALSAAALKILQKRKQLPCWAVKQKFLDLVRDNQVTVLVGETGSGKTTQMPQFLAEVYSNATSSSLNEKKMVAVTQPRRVAAMSVATRVAEEMDVPLGQECGYLIRFEDKTSPDTVVKYMTDGMLLRECMTDPMLSKYSVICLDEAHERTLSTDILFGLLKRVLPKRPELKVVVMSATLEAEKFQAYFGKASSKLPPLLTVSGRMFPVDIKYTQTAQRDYVQGSVDRVMEIVKTDVDSSSPDVDGNSKGDILIFLTGEEEIETCCRALEEQLPEDDNVVLPLYSSLPPQQQKRVFQNFDGQRKIVVATNVAETSITIDGVVHVIDCGLVKVKVYNPRTHVECLLVNPISKAAAKQRAGRAGRTRPGTCYRLYTENAFNTSLLESSWPEILRTNLGSAVLTLLNLGVEDVVHFDWMDPPSPECMMRALDLLLQLGAVNDECELTECGRKLAEFPLDPQLGKCLLRASELGVTKQMAAIIALISGAPAHMRPRMYQKQADRAHKKFNSVHGDHLTMLNIFEAYEANKANLKQWAYENYLKDRSLSSAGSVQRQLLRLCAKLDVPVSDNAPTEEGDTVQSAIRKALIAGFFQQVAHISGKQYTTVRDRQLVEIHPGSGLEHKPEWILYHELVLTDKNYLRTVTALRSEWLVSEKPTFFPDQVVNEEARKGLQRYVKK
ncbi:unnamed protein product [Amoebophrya sp. A25]|nr:unnamed protein product [Amoebophrya sp. A25]|eukprot:GSA25T00003100001.1